MIKRLLAGIITFCMCITPVMAEPNENTGVFFSINCDNDIKISPEDIFELKVSKQSSGDREEILESCTTLSVSVKDNDNVDVYPLDPGIYYVYDIKYLGSNTDIVAEGFAYSNIFEVSNNPSEIYSVDLSIGTESVNQLCNTYDGVSVSRNNEYLSAMEAINNTKQSSNENGEIPKMNEPVVSENDLIDEHKDTNNNTEENTKDKVEEKETEQHKKSSLPKLIFGITTLSIIIGIASIIYVKKKK